jgi:hypothetical protein
MDPMMPSQSNTRLDDLALDLVARASSLAGQVHPIVRREVGGLVRSMNCYYSNLVAGSSAVVCSSAD